MQREGIIRLTLTSNPLRLRRLPLGPSLYWCPIELCRTFPVRVYAPNRTFKKTGYFNQMNSKFATQIDLKKNFKWRYLWRSLRRWLCIRTPTVCSIPPMMLLTSGGGGGAGCCCWLLPPLTTILKVQLVQLLFQSFKPAGGRRRPPPLACRWWRQNWNTAPGALALLQAHLASHRRWRGTAQSSVVHQ